ncbi:MAG: hypothetical protein ABIT38_18070 [Gemmatimonadaceae bacterium]
MSFDDYFVSIGGCIVSFDDCFFRSATDFSPARYADCAKVYFNPRVDCSHGESDCVSPPVDLAGAPEAWRMDELAVLETDSEGYEPLLFRPLNSAKIAADRDQAMSRD